MLDPYLVKFDLHMLLTILIFYLNWTHNSLKILVYRKKTHNYNPRNVSFGIFYMYEILEEKEGVSYKSHNYQVTIQIYMSVFPNVMITI